ncbi:MAG: hypothetical protein ABI182_03600 [Candidatus Baltobacteraceae bacterium]
MRASSLVGEPKAFVLGGSSSTLVFVNSFRPEKNAITARLVPLAITPLGVVIGDAWQNVGIALDNLLPWIDQTFPPEDERAFVAPVRDIELLARIEWDAETPGKLDEDGVLNAEDLPEEITHALSQPPSSILQCASCRRLCVRDHFVWNERQLCAWDYHSTVFGKRGPWRDGPYEERFFETLPRAAYIAPELLGELDVEVILATGLIKESTAHSLINLALASDPGRAQLAVRTAGGFTLLRERAGAPPL